MTVNEMGRKLAEASTTGELANGETWTINSQMITNGEALPNIGNPRFLALLDEVKDTHVRKAAGYSGQDNPDTWANFREAEAWGLTPLEGCYVRMGDKYRRIQNLRRDPSNDKVGESIRDTLMDLANYALIAVCLLEEEQQAALEAKTKTILTDGMSEIGVGQEHLPEDKENPYREGTLPYDWFESADDRAKSNVLRRLAYFGPVGDVERAALKPYQAPVTETRPR